MSRHFLELAVTPGVHATQEANGTAAMFAGLEDSGTVDRLAEREISFIAARDSFYMATVSETGWPYIQHRGGPVGFLRVLDDRTLAFADYRGNRQYLSLGNLAADDRVALFLMDYPNRRRLKLLARAEPRDLTTDPDLAARLAVPGYRARAERAILLHVEAFDWNCPQHITPRFTETEIHDAVEPVRARMTQLEAENAALRARLGLTTPTEETQR